LCNPCNNTTGADYAPSFIDWCRQGMIYHEKTDGHPTRLDINRTRPLSIIKRILTMFLSVNEDMFLYRANEDLTSFVSFRRACKTWSPASGWEVGQRTLKDSRWSSQALGECWARAGGSGFRGGDIKRTRTSGR